MVKTRKNNLHLEVSNDVDVEYETASSIRRRTKKGKGLALTKIKKPKMSVLVVNGQKIPLANSKMSMRKKMSAKTKSARKASSAGIKRAVLQRR